MPRKPLPPQAPDPYPAAAPGGAPGGEPKPSTKTLRSRTPRPYEVGYAKPPADSQFKPGHSGNPNGRPKGRRTGQAPIMERLKSIVIDEAYRTIKIKDGERQISISIAQAAIRSLGLNAVKGQSRAQKQFADLLRDVEAQNRADHHAWLQVAIDYKLSFERDIQRAKDQGLTPPDPVPHPEDIIIDFVTNEVRIIGPLTEEDKAIHHAGWRIIVQFDAEIAEAELRLEKQRSDKATQKLMEYIDFRRAMRDKVAAFYGEPPRRFRTPTNDYAQW